MIINIIGPNGSGKSTVVRELMKLDPKCAPLHDGDGAIEGYSLMCGSSSIAIVGRYTKPCGGCDTIQKKEEIQRRIKLFARYHDHVIFEGIIVSTSFGTYQKFLAELGDSQGYKHKFAVLDTKIDQCIKNVVKRRKARGADVTDFNEENLRNKHAYIERVKLKCADEHTPWCTLRYKHALDDLTRLLV